MENEVLHECGDFQNSQGKFSRIIPPAMSKKPVVIGIYGVSGCGKSHLLNELKSELRGDDSWIFFEGSEVIDRVCPGGLAMFHTLGEDDKAQCRRVAIKTVKDETLATRRSALITGHSILWTGEQGQSKSQIVYTADDMSTLSHILYINLPADTIASHRLNDLKKARPLLSTVDLSTWQENEITLLRRLSRENDILFLAITSEPDLVAKSLTFIRDFQSHSESNNTTRALESVDEAIFQTGKLIETAIVLDGDKTMTESDSGERFWQSSMHATRTGDRSDPLRHLFNSPLGYSYLAFRQATLLYEDVAAHNDFDGLCESAAAAVMLHAQFVDLLRAAATRPHIHAFIVTCGLRTLWDKVIRRYELSHIVTVIGGGLMSDGYVVTPKVKGSLVCHLKAKYRSRVWAFGDSPLDLDMLKHADQAIVVVGNESTRSRSMDRMLRVAIMSGELHAQQVLLPQFSAKRLDEETLPVVDITAVSFHQELFARRQTQRTLCVHATEKASAKLMMTPMRNANLSGPLLRQAHRTVGWYLSVEYVGNLIGLERYSVAHVQGGTSDGFRLAYENQVTIVALMRGGEPMALGVNDAFPEAMFVHAQKPEDLDSRCICAQKALVLVDSVVNTGASIIAFVRHVREINSTIQIVVVAGVVQADSVGMASKLMELCDNHLSIVALRISDNKYTGSGGTDTGNRLFNTTHLIKEG